VRSLSLRRAKTLEWVGAAHADGDPGMRENIVSLLTGDTERYVGAVIASA
jgi:hypothetical protein